MAYFNRKKAKDDKEEKEISFTRVFQIPSSDQNIMVDTLKSFNILDELLRTNDMIEAIDLIVDKTPDGKMALNTYLRLINQGFHINLYNRETNELVEDYDGELREFCERMGGSSSNGLDGLAEQLCTSEILHGGMAVEVVVSKGADDIEQVVVIDPKYIKEFKWLPNENRYAAYQQSSGGEKRDLYEGNFFWIPHQPKPGKPYGTYQFEPAVSVMTQVYEFLRDIAVVLNRIGFPKYNITVDFEKMLASAPNDIKADDEKRAKWMSETMSKIRTQMAGISRDSNIIHSDGITIEVIGGGMNGSGIDVRAWGDIHEPLIVNAFQLTPVLMGRLKSGSYSLGTAEYRIVKDNMEVFRRSLKRMIENIINLWARVKGYNVYAVLTHNPIEWQVEKEKYEAELKKLERARRAEEFGYIAHEDASYMALGDKANPQEAKEDKFAYLKSFSNNIEAENSNDNEKSEDKKNEEKN